MILSWKVTRLERKVHKFIVSPETHMTRKPEYVNIDTIKGKQRNAQLENEKTRVKNSLGRCQDHAVVYGLEDDFNAWLKKIAVDYQVLKAKSAKAGK